MVYIFAINKLRTVYLSSILVTFSMAVVTPSCYSQQITGNDIAFGIIIERIIEKVWKYVEKKDSNKLLDAMIEIKQEVESYTGTKIDMDKQIDQIERDLKQKGVKIEKKEMKTLRKKLKDREKKANQRTLCMAQYLEDTVNITFREYEFLHKSAKKHEENKEKEEKLELPLRFVIGVTASLCGLFLGCVPVPVCKAAGGELVKYGLALAVEGYVNGQEDEKKDN